MPRQIQVPAQTMIEDIRALEEFPAGGVTPGIINVTVGLKTADGEWVERSYKRYEITGALYEELVADTPPAWAPDKPAGTYHNDHLWYAIDMVREALRAAAENKLDLTKPPALP